VAKVERERDGAVSVITLNRPEVRNAIDAETAGALADAFRDFDADPELSVAVMTGAGGCFCAGADLKAISAAEGANRITPDGDGPIGPSRMVLEKPVVAAVEGFAVAGGLELALWCDLRVAARDAVFGVYCRRWGVPLVDGGTIRLPRLIGQSHAMDMILTGRGVAGEEAAQMGLANRLVERGGALEAALELAGQLARFPQQCMRGDRRSALEQWGMPMEWALQNELRIGMAAIHSGETRDGATRFREGAGRHGHFE
jgi:enoyl-CoA hydratase